MTTEESPIRENCQPAFTVEGGDPAAREFVQHFVDTNSHGIMHATMNAMREGFIDDRVLPAPTPQAPQRPIARNFRGYAEAISVTARIQELSTEAPVRCGHCGLWSFLAHARHVCPGYSRHAVPRTQAVRGPQPSLMIIDELDQVPEVGVTHLHYRGSARSGAQIGIDPAGPDGNPTIVLRNPDGSVSYARDPSRARPWKGIPRDELEDGMTVMVTLPMRVMTAEAANARRVAAMPLDMVRNLVACPYGGIIEIREYIE